MNAFWLALSAGILTTAVGALFQLWLYRKLRNERGSQDEITQLQRDLVIVRGQIKYIQGVLNGKHWERAEE